MSGSSASDSEAPPPYWMGHAPLLLIPDFAASAVHESSTGPNGDTVVTKVWPRGTVKAADAAVPQIIDTRFEKQFFSTEDNSFAALNSGRRGWTAPMYGLAQELVKLGFLPGLDLFCFPWAVTESPSDPVVVQRFKDVVEKITAFSEAPHVISHGIGGVIVKVAAGDVTLASWTSLSLGFGGINADLLVGALGGVVGKGLAPFCHLVSDASDLLATPPVAFLYPPRGPSKCNVAPAVLKTIVAKKTNIWSPDPERSSVTTAVLPATLIGDPERGLLSTRNRGAFALIKGRPRSPSPMVGTMSDYLSLLYPDGAPEGAAESLTEAASVLTAQMPSVSYPVHLVYGTSHKTAAAATLLDAGRVSYEYVNGDGVVPIASVRAEWLRVTSRVPVHARYCELPSSKEVISFICELVGFSMEERAERLAKGGLVASTTLAEIVALAIESEDAPLPPHALNLYSRTPSHPLLHKLTDCLDIPDAVKAARYGVLRGRSAVLLCPGCGGTTLKYTDTATGAHGWLWPKLGGNAHYLPNYMWGSYEGGGRGTYRPFNPHSTIVVSDENFGLNSMRTLLPEVPKRMQRFVTYFAKIQDFFIANNYTPGVDLFGFPWCWMESTVCDSLQDALEERIKVAYRACGGRKLDIVGHSLGCNLVRSFLADRPHVFQYIRSFTALGAPFAGACAYLLRSMVNGYNLRLPSNIFPWWCFRQLNCQGAYSLIPSPADRMPPQYAYVRRFKDAKEGRKLGRAKIASMTDAQLDEMCEWIRFSMSAPDPTGCFKKAFGREWEWEQDVPSSMATLKTVTNEDLSSALTALRNNSPFSGTTTETEPHDGDEIGICAGLDVRLSTPGSPLADIPESPHVTLQAGAHGQKGTSVVTNSEEPGWFMRRLQQHHTRPPPVSGPWQRHPIIAEAECESRHFFDLVNRVAADEEFSWKFRREQTNMAEAEFLDDNELSDADFEALCEAEGDPLSSEPGTRLAESPPPFLHTPDLETTLDFSPFDVPPSVRYAVRPEIWQEYMENRRKVGELGSKVPNDFKFVSVAGSGCATPVAIIYPDPITRWRDVAHQKPRYICGDGDGTVHVASALAHGFPERCSRTIVVENSVHLNIAKGGKSYQMIRETVDGLDG